jgi:hypothetical protein
MGCCRPRGGGQSCTGGANSSSSSSSLLLAAKQHAQQLQQQNDALVRDLEYERRQQGRARQQVIRDVQWPTICRKPFRTASSTFDASA